MNIKELLEAFKKEFDVVGIIKSKRYFEAAKLLNIDIPINHYPTLITLGFAYSKRIMKANETDVYASFYTFGQDYHKVLKSKIKKVMDQFEIDYLSGVDNHPHDERLAANLSGIGFLGKNQLIINPSLGSYLFLGMVFVDIQIEQEFIQDVIDNCGDCRICIDACPTHALSDIGYNRELCISQYNQSKKIFSQKEIKANYCLFGCDVCQLVCPKNIGIKQKNHPEFELSGREAVKYQDLFTLSEKQFKDKYHDMAYLWKGKTILMRNALTVLLRQKNSLYNDLIAASIDKHPSPWYQETAIKILEELKKI